VLTCHLVAATLVGLVARSYLGPLGVLVAVVVEVVVFYVFAEAAPKTYALQHPERTAIFVAPVVDVLAGFLPVRIATRALIGLTNVVLPGKGRKTGPAVSEEDLLALADVAVEAGEIESEERALIRSIIDFGDTVAREVMVPRLDMITLPAAMPVSEALDVAIEHGFSRLPVVGTTVDDVKGLAYAKDLMRAEREGRGGEAVSGILRPANFVPETKPVAVLMREMQAGKFHMALLVDEHGGIAGVVTLEDLLEELVGDIIDEYDTEDAEVERLDDGGFRVQGSVPIDELNDLLESDIPHDGWDTVGGFVLGELGRVPEPGESLKHRQWTFTVEEIEGRRVGAVRVTEDPDWEPVDDYEDS
jgi:CBS domain containing-hemolysin-like protein